MKYLLSLFFLIGLCLPLRAASIDERALRQDQFTTNLPSAHYIGIKGYGVTNIPGTNVQLNAGTGITFTTNAAAVTITATGTNQVGVTNVTLRAGPNIDITTNQPQDWTVSTTHIWTNDSFTDGIATGVRIVRPVDTTRSIALDQVSTNWFGITVRTMDTNSSDTYNNAAYFWNHSTNAGVGSLYFNNGNYGVIGESDGNRGSKSIGDLVGVAGAADGGLDSMYGVLGFAYSQYANQTNVGTVGIGGAVVNNGIQVGGYFETPVGAQNTITTPVFQPSVILADNRNSSINLLILRTNGSSIFEVRTNADIRINTPVYRFPATNGSPGQGLFTDGSTPQRLYWATFATGAGSNSVAVAAGTNITLVTNSDLVTISVSNTNLPVVVAGTNVTVVTNGLAYTVSGEPGGGGTSTNAVKDIITNQIPNFIHGTTNYIARFTPNTNEVGDSIMVQQGTNTIEWRSRYAGTSWTNEITNRIYGANNSSTNYEALEIISGHSLAGHRQHIIRGVQGPANTLGIVPLVLNETMFVEPGANAMAGHAAGAVYPGSDAFSALGSTSARWHGVYSDTIGMFIADGAPFRATTYGVYLQTTGIWLNSIADGFCVMVQRNTDANRGLAIGPGVIGGGPTSDQNWDTFITRGNEAGTWNFTTNNAGASPRAVVLESGKGTGSDKPAADMIIAGGRATGTGRGGAMRIQTSPSASSTSASANSLQNRLYISPVPVTLTESSATLVFNVALASGKSCGIHVYATTKADDGAEFQCVTEDFVIAAVNKGGTVTTSVSASALTAAITTLGTLTTTWTAVANGASVDVKVSAVSSLSQTTLNTRWRCELDGDGTLAITAQ